jgi:hypothetical protein
MNQHELEAQSRGPGPAHSSTHLRQPAAKGRPKDWPQQGSNRAHAKQCAAVGGAADVCKHRGPCCRVRCYCCALQCPEGQQDTYAGCEDEWEVGQGKHDGGEDQHRLAAKPVASWAPQERSQPNGNLQRQEKRDVQFESVTAAVDGNVGVLLVCWFELCCAHTMQETSSPASCCCGSHQPGMRRQSW